MKQLIKKCSIAAIVALGITLSPGALRTTPEGQQKIAGWEDCRNTPYYCTAGVLTVGIGSTGRVEKRSTVTARSPVAGLTICGTLKTVLTRILKAGICHSPPLRP
jgi:GH24 family phage-related lysozyme (muramidase)